MSEDWFEDHKALTEDQKKILVNELKKFDEYGEAVYQEQDLNELGKKLEALSEYAKRYLNEKAKGSFDQVTINRNMKELDKKVRKFRKEAEKVQKHQDRLTALYDDVGIIFDRYFGVGGNQKSETIEESKKVSADKIQITESDLRKLIREELNERAGVHPSTFEQVKKELAYKHRLDVMDSGTADRGHYVELGTGQRVEFFLRGSNAAEIIVDGQSVGRARLSRLADAIANASKSGTVLDPEHR